jgi:hypothetical protein
MCFAFVAFLAVSGPLLFPFAAAAPLFFGLPQPLAWILGWLFMTYGMLFLYSKTENLK